MTKNLLTHREHAEVKTIYIHKLIENRLTR